MIMKAVEICVRDAKAVLEKDPMKFIVTSTPANIGELMDVKPSDNDDLKRLRVNLSNSYGIFLQTTNDLSIDELINLFGVLSSHIRSLEEAIESTDDQFSMQCKSIKRDLSVYKTLANYADIQTKIRKEDMQDKQKSL